MSDCRRPTAVVAACVVLLAAPLAHAATLVVPDDYPTIQAALNASGSGDEILVRPGSFGESLFYGGPGVTVIGLGATNDVQVLPPSGRCLEVGASATIAFESVTFAAGVADSGGGALVRGKAAFRACAFASNRSHGAGTNCSYGGGVLVAPGGEAAFEKCSFTHNFVGNGGSLWCMEGNGGGLYVAAGASARADKTSFTHNTAGGFEGGWAGAAGVEGTATFTACEFDSNAAGYGGALAGNVQVADSRFFGNQTQWGPSAVDLRGSGPIERCVFHDNASLAAPVLVVGGPARIELNTFAWNIAWGGFGGVRCIEFHDPGAEFRRNIVARNDGVGIAGEAAVAFSCNDVWGNTGGDYDPVFGDRTGIDDNFSADPLFCDSALRVLTLRTNSPCASPGPCGRIGALPVACNPVSSVPTGELAIEMTVYPNPALDLARVSFQLAAAARVRLDVVDVSGRRVATLADGVLPAGTHQRTWQASGLGGPGVYFVRLGVGSRVVERRIVLLDRGRAR